MSSISAGTTVNTGLTYSSDTTGTLQIKTGASAVTAVDIDGSGVFKFNSGYGSVATAYGCRAWVNFNGTGTVAIRSSGNVSSITDNGVGDYTVNFTTAMPDANYAFNGAVQTANTGSRTFQNVVFDMWDGAGHVATSGLRFSTSTLQSSTTYDCAICTVSIFR